MPDDDSEIRASRLQVYRLRVEHQRLSWRQGAAVLWLLYAPFGLGFPVANLARNDGFWDQTVDLGTLLVGMAFTALLGGWLRRLRSDRAILREEMAQLDALPVLPSWVPAIMAAVIASATALSVALLK